MNVACPECRSVFRVDPARIPVQGIRARCALCGGVIPVEPAAVAGGGAWPTPASSARHPGAGAAIPGIPAPAAPAPPSAAPRVATPPVASPPVAGPRIATPPVVTPPVATHPAATPPAATPPAPASWAAAAPVTSPPAAASATPQISPRPRVSGPSGARPPINPFLANDPGQKARRLARALVSDIIAYHPQLREQGLRDGTLKQLFKEEIKKSYEEYIEQVGRETADGTTHFQEALNDILADGRKLF